MPKTETKTPNYAIILHPLDADDGGGFVGLVPDLPGCIGDGETADEALADTKCAIAEWLESNAALGRDVPVPGTEAKKLRRRDDAFLEAMRAAVDIMDRQEGAIITLERKLEVLMSLMQEDRMPRQFVQIGFASKRSLPKPH